MFSRISRFGMIFLAVWILVTGSFVFANTIHVNSTADVDDDFDGICTLRQAIRYANTDSAPIGPAGECDAASGDDTIDFTVSGTITLGATLPQIDSNMTIDGSGQTITISGNDLYRVFYVHDGTFILNALTIVHGLGDSGGGAIANFGLTRVSNCTFSDNQAGAFGGAIETFTFVSVKNSTFTNNFSGNTGGAIGCNGSMDISNSTFTNNGAVFGGAMALECSSNVTNSTISGNYGSLGGGILADIDVDIYNTIVTNNTNGDCYYVPGTFTADSFNLDSDGTCDNATTTASINLGALADNGGLTKTMALLSGSAALDAGDDTVCANAPVNNLDQRGVARPQGAHCDTGAFEVEAGLACAYSSGFWKTHPSAWPVSMLMLGSQLYTEQELLILMAASKTKDASLVLAFQLIAAKLNVANGSGSSIQPVIDDSDALLAGFGGKLPYNVRSSSSQGKQMVSLAKQLETYNLTQTANCTP